MTRPALLAGLVAVCGLAAPAPAQSTWTAGGGNTNFSTAGNWTTPPASGADVIFGTGGSAAVLDLNFTLGLVRFNSSASRRGSSSPATT